MARPILEQFDQWVKFYKNQGLEGLEYKFEGLVDSLRRLESEKVNWALPIIKGRQSEFNRLLVMVPEMGINEWIKFLEAHHPVCFHLVGQIVSSDRQVDSGPYAVFVRDLVEATDATDEGLAEDPTKVGRITLEERLAYEAMFFQETGGGHLDIQGATICSGSHYKDGGVPVVDWHNNQLYIRWCYPNVCRDSRSRVRQVVLLKLDP